MGLRQFTVRSQSLGRGGKRKRGWPGSCRCKGHNGQWLLVCLFACFNQVLMGFLVGSRMLGSEAEVVCEPFQSTMRKPFRRTGSPGYSQSSDSPQLPPPLSTPLLVCRTHSVTMSVTPFGGLALHVSLHCSCKRHRGTTPLGNG